MEGLTREEIKISDEAVEFIKRHKKELVTRFIGNEEKHKTDQPIALFMAGSPGAGKTEFVRRFITRFKEERGEWIIHIDADAIREMIPGYVGGNSYVYQRAAVRGVDILLDHVMKNRKSFVLDGTFSRYDFADKNISRSLKHSFLVVVAYLYLDPTNAWKFTQARELVEGRRVSRDVFIDKFIGARDTLLQVRDNYLDKIEYWYVKRDLLKGTFDISLEPSFLDSENPLSYSRDDLRRVIL